jgi:transaldolase
MEFFLDTAVVDEVRDAARYGVITGVTTNPSLAARAGVGGIEGYKVAVQEISAIIDGPVSVEVLSQDAEGMVKEALEFSKWASDVWIKLPSTPAGFEAMAQVVKEGVRVNQTLCFSVNQALLGGRIGATVVSPFIGRLDDIGHNGMDLVLDIKAVFELHGIETRVLAASIRNNLHCVDAAKVGADIATVPYGVFNQMMNHPLTDLGMARFIQDWEKALKG